MCTLQVAERILCLKLYLASVLQYEKKSSERRIFFIPIFFQYPMVKKPNFFPHIRLLKEGSTYLEVIEICYTSVRRGPEKISAIRGQKIFKVSKKTIEEVRAKIFSE